MGILFHYAERKGTRTGAGVNECPVGIQSRAPTKREREFECLRGYQRKKDAHAASFFVMMHGEGNRAGENSP